VRDLVNNLPLVESVDLEIDSLVSISNTEWSKLETLTSFRLLGRMESVVLHPEMLSALKNLQKLDLVHVRLPQFSPAMVAALSKVSFLSLKNILAAKPRRKSGFTLWNALPGLKSLKELVVIGAGRDAELPRSALACSALERLGVRECSHVGHWPLQNSTLAITNSIQETSYPALDTLQHLSLADVGLTALPSAAFWGHCQSLTSLTWFNVHHAAPRHRYWDHGGACELTNAMEPVLRMLRVLCLEFSGMNEEQLTSTAGALHSAVKLKELSLRGNRLGGVHGSEIANATIHDKIELDSLSLVNCGLSKVPADIFSLSSLTKLDLSNNPRLETSKEEDRKLDKIKVVNRNDRKAMLLASLPTFRVGDCAEGLALGV
jgi:Leucine-rich repeat (LRR) protein